ncbi:MAG: ATP-binding protein [Pseudomonadota bacterium]|nr:ATP-binding protein [Pseudomonadota bacterium]
MNVSILEENNSSLFGQHAQRFADNFPSAIVLTDVHGKVVYLNRFAERYLPQDFTRVLHQSFSVVISPSSLGLFNDAFRNVVAEGGSFSLDVDTITDLERSSLTIFALDEETLCITLQACPAGPQSTDDPHSPPLSEQNEALHKQRRLYEAALSNSPDPVYIFDLSGRFTYVNDALLDIWGITWDEAVGKTLYELNYEKWHADRHMQEIEQVIATKQPIRRDVPYHGAHGLRMYDYIFVPVLDAYGNVEAIAGSTRDVTERYEAEKIARDADKRKDEFLATLAHELRNPLAPIRNALEILQSDQFSQQKKNESFELVGRQVTQMVRLVDDLMDVSRITRGKIKLERAPLDICSAIHDALETAQPVIDENHHALSINFPEENVWVDGDSVRLAQIFTNIINNAAKYTPSGGEISIDVKPAGALINVEIRDNGIGIPSDKLNEVFTMFSQVEGVLERSQGGLGIGLTLVKRLVEMHGGNVSVQSDSSGTLFTVSLPRIDVDKREIQKATASKPEYNAADSSPLTVLIADDNQDAAITMGWILEAKGCDVVVVEDGPSALKAVDNFSPDLILLDIGMPGMNGYDLCIALREMPELEHSVFVAQTGWGQPSHIKRSQEAGFHHHLVKPLDMGDLIPIVDEVRQLKSRLSS